MFSYVWGVMAPMGKLVTCLGRQGCQNRIKGSRRVRPCRRSGIRSVPNLWFSSDCYAWANKTWCFAMVDGSGRSTAVVKPYSRTLAHQITTLGAPLLWSSHIRDPWRIKSPLWALHCCGQAIFETPGAANHHSGRSTAVVKPYTRPWHIKSQAFANFWGSGPTDWAADPSKTVCLVIQRSITRP